ncbi:tyrosine-protein phosphatase [Frankia sp. R82]|uniref:tyrosine-protein phosphatase n=1 Tax=Frankia sp. R82 TaxID=2950553 RepID=UPI0020444399|nr:tyrosine-protein phosphatase [Frankia sp. R82]MCM3886512.1 tyrosine-protein phosphatase [Frankia sp. R82]
MTDSAAARRGVDWEGFVNTRDLGRLPIRGGGATRYGVYYRSGDPRFGTDAGWAAARAAGLRTVVDLRNDDEIRPGLPNATAAAGTVGVDNQNPLIDAQLAAHNTTAHQAVLDIADGFDAETYLLAAGVTSADLEQIRRRLIRR